MKKASPPYLGAAYYPESWPVDQIDPDIARMKEAGINVARMGEFIWGKIEPEEGKYDFSLLHIVVDKLTEQGIAVVLCTPSCTPPVWLSEKHPEILVVKEDGVRCQHGARRHACPNNPVYRSYCEKIVIKMAQEFGNHDNIIGWQIDNELYPHGNIVTGQLRGCCCPVCHDKFKDSMQKKYGTIDELNKAWGTSLWSQEYQNFEQLPIPRLDTWHHPSLLTEWALFQSDSYVDFSNHQADILHKMTKHIVGTDMMPFNGLNYTEIHRDLDLVQFNHYNNSENLWTAAFWFDFIRTIKERPFWNTETATCWGGGVFSTGYNERGFCRANSWLPIALGGEANMYWLWRAHRSGHELMHGSVLSSCGKPMHIFEEVREISQGYEKAASFINNTKPERSGLALHFSSYAWWLYNFQPMLQDFNYSEKMTNNIYHPLIQAQLRPDIIDPEKSLSPYKVVLSPFLPCLEEGGLLKRLEEWIEQGGTWIVGPMSDIRTMDAAKYMDSNFGYIEKWAGVSWKYFIPCLHRDIKMKWQDGIETSGFQWYDGFTPDGAEVLASYCETELEGLAAITRHKKGKGQIIVVGTILKPDDWCKLILKYSAEAGIFPVAKATSNLLVVPRTGEGGKGMIVIELTHKPAKIEIPCPMTDVLTGRSLLGEVYVEPHEVLVLKE